MMFLESLAQQHSVSASVLKETGRQNGLVVHPLLHPISSVSPMWDKGKVPPRNWEGLISGEHHEPSLLRAAW